ncbi:hypothetical protein QTG54_004194 [Skeletonema marinoi]|uniref:Uncharacterized protein n=1 Tax=Skeletonema marinoi TaxID=267567 RepID=A0AAD8YFH1_9STRA|nr:hypothetical protein QTG54_004194 [Skeletonema marinoi]
MCEKECERFGNIGAYRGFEFSVGKRCTCLFDVDQAPPVPDSGEAPDYVGGSDGGDGDVFSTTSMPGTTCFASREVGSKSKQLLPFFLPLLSLCCSRNI